MLHGRPLSKPAEVAALDHLNRDWLRDALQAESDRDRYAAEVHRLSLELQKVRAAVDETVCSVPWCGAERSEFSRTGLCLDHMGHAWEDMRNFHASLPEYERPRRHPDEDSRHSDFAKANVVYYIEMSAGRIKIGMTGRLKQRMRSFYAQPDQLLAVEPCTNGREGERHRQFASDRIGATELFAPSQGLLEHIKLVREMFGDPLHFLD